MEVPNKDQANLDPVFNFTPTQLRLLQERIQGFAVQLLTLRFNEPENDDLKIRQHANIMGSMEALQEIVKYDANLRAYQEATSRQNEKKEDGTDPSLSSVGPSF